MPWYYVFDGANSFLSTETEINNNNENAFVYLHMNKPMNYKHKHVMECGSAIQRKNIPFNCLALKEPASNENNLPTKLHQKEVLHYLTDSCGGGHTSGALYVSPGVLRKGLFRTHTSSKFVDRNTLHKATWFDCYVCMSGINFSFVLHQPISNRYDILSKKVVNQYCKKNEKW